MAIAMRCVACFLLLAAVPLIWTDHLAADEPAADFSPAIDSPQLLRPAQDRAEVDRDRIAAEAHYLESRLLAQRGETAAALRQYQRAWRYGPAGGALRDIALDEIMHLALELNRDDEAARYAALLAQVDAKDKILVRRLALHLTTKRDWPRAVKLYEKLLAAMDAPNKDAPNQLDLAAVAIHFELGRLYYLTDQFAQSADAFAKVRAALDESESPLTVEAKGALVGKPEQTFALWAEAFLEAKRYDEAAELFRKAQATKSDAADLAFDLARVELGRGDTAATLARLEEYAATKSSAAGTEPYELLADLHARMTARVEEARKLTIDRLESWHKDDPENAPLMQALAEQYVSAQRLVEAERLLAKVLTLQPTSETYRHLADIYRRQNLLENLLTTLAHLASRTGSLDGLGESGKALAADQGLVTRLVEQTRKALAENSGSLADGQVLSMALLSRATGQFETADELFGQALPGIKPGPGEALMQWGLSLLAADQPERAARAFGRILDERLIAGGEASALFFQSAALELAGRTDEALAAATRATELSPANAQFAARKGWILYHARRLDAARQAYVQVVEKYDPRHDAAGVREVLREARLALSNIDLAQGQFAAAVEWLEQVLDEFPDDAGANNDLGYLWAERGQHLERSLRMIQAAVGSAPDNKAYRDSLGWALFQLGHYAEAEKELAAAAAGDEPDGVILDHWGDALARLGKGDAALAAWRRAEAAFQKADEAEKLAKVREKITAADK